MQNSKQILPCGVRIAHQVSIETRSLIWSALAVERAH